MRNRWGVEVMTLHIIFLILVGFFLSGACFAQIYELSEAEKRLLEERDTTLIQQHVQKIFPSPIGKSLKKVYTHEFHGLDSYFVPIPFRGTKVVNHTVDGEYWDAVALAFAIMKLRSPYKLVYIGSQDYLIINLVLVPDLKAMLLDPEAVPEFKPKNVTYEEYESRVRNYAKVTNVYSRTERAPDGNLANAYWIVGVAGRRPSEIRNIVLRELVHKFLGGQPESNLIRPSLMNTGEHGIGQAFDFVENYRRLPLIDYLVLQATAVVASTPETEWPKTAAEFTEIVAGLMSIPELSRFPSDLYKLYPSQ